MATKITKIKKIPTIKKKEIKKSISSKVVSAVQKKKKSLVVATGEACFWVNNGPSLSSMKDLRDALRNISEEQYSYHAGMGRNDFSSWTKDILGDKKCANDLLKAKDMKSALSAVEKHLKGYSV